MEYTSCPLGRKNVWLVKKNVRALRISFLVIEMVFSQIQRENNKNPGPRSCGGGS